MLQDCDRPKLRTSEEAIRRATSMRLQPSHFDPECGEPSIDKDKLRQITAPKKTWPSPSPETAQCSGLLWYTLLHHAGSDEDVQAFWKCLLFQPLSMVLCLDHDENNGGLVLRATQYGVLVWRMRLNRRTRGAANLFENDDDAKKLDIIVPEDISRWRTCAIRALRPAKLESVMRAGGVPSRGTHVGLAREGAVDTMYAFAAKKAFPGLTVPHLKKAMKDLGMRFSARDRPKRLVDILRALIRRCLPDLSPEEVDELIAKRGCAVSHGEQASVLAEPGVLDMMGNLLDDGDMDIAADAVKDSAQASERQRQETSRAQRASDAPGAASSSGAAPPTPPPLAAPLEAPPTPPLAPPVVGRPLPPPHEGAHVWSQEQLATFLPAVRGVRMWPGDAYHLRWRVKYPAKPPHAGTSRTFGGARSERSAILYCLMWAWRTHQHFHPDAVCPWEFPDA